MQASLEECVTIADVIINDAALRKTCQSALNQQGKSGIKKSQLCLQLFPKSSKQDGYVKSARFRVSVFYQGQLIKDASRFRFCTAVADPTHREGAFDQVGKIPLAIPQGFTHPTSAPPFLASLACRFQPLACSEDQFLRSTSLSLDPCNQTCVSPQLYKNKVLTYCAAHRTT